MAIRLPKTRIIRPLNSKPSFKGAQASGIIPTVMRTAEANRLDMRAYLGLLSEEHPNLPVLDNPNNVQKYLPWQRRCAKQSTELEW